MGVGIATYGRSLLQHYDNTINGGALVMRVNLFANYQMAGFYYMHSFTLAASK